MSNAPESVEARLARIDERLVTMSEGIEAIKKELDGKYVTQAEFWPVRTIVYSGAALVLLAVLGALVALVVRGYHPDSVPEVHVRQTP